jgi:hypothetical protein
MGVEYWLAVTTHCHIAIFFAKVDLPSNRTSEHPVVSSIKRDRQV